MTTHKSFKSRIHTHMAKTGESYTTARRHLLAKSQPRPAAAKPVEVPMSRKVSDSALRDRTGRGWAEWFALLDDWGGADHNHTQTVRWLADAHGVDNWSAQSVTVGYQQARGMRVLGQQSNGAFTAYATRDRGRSGGAVVRSLRRRRDSGQMVARRQTAGPHGDRAEVLPGRLGGRRHQDRGRFHAQGSREGGGLGGA